MPQIDASNKYSKHHRYLKKKLSLQVLEFLIKFNEIIFKKMKLFIMR